MTQLLEENILASYERFEKQQRNGGAWIEQRRRRAIERFAEAGFPGKSEEEWRFTNIAPIVNTAFAPAEHASVARDDIEHLSFAREAAAELVFVNGFFARELSSVRDLPQGVQVSSLAEALANGNAALEAHLAQHADIEKNPFVALNTGFIGDGACIRVVKGAIVKKPIHLIFVSTPAAEAAVSHPRVLVLAEDEAEATVVETYAAARDGVYFTNAVTEVVQGRNSRIDHYKLQQESLQAYHVATMQVQLDRASLFTAHSASIGSAITRNDLNAVLGGEEASATLNGLVLIGGNQHVDNHTLLDHAKPHCPSHELYKHVLSGTASGVFRGKILVRQDAQKTDSKQTSRSLLLSDTAIMNSQPALEIYADDVKCTHGSTTGPLSEEMLFYLRQRGVGIQAAKHLLTYAFAADITRRIAVEPVRRRLEDFMAAQHGLPQDIRITDLAAHDEQHR
jgi:Fe-S cluster assembly protein SufD